MLVIFLVSATETIGDTSALASSGLNREVSKKELTGSIAADGFVSALSGLFGCLPITSFSQNVGLVSMTKVVNRFTIFHRLRYYGFGRIVPYVRNITCNIA